MKNNLTVLVTVLCIASGVLVQGSNAEVPIKSQRAN
jgi:hypothetical protein